ncbi:phosphoinositide 3-kinase adapter protein 1 [Thalassophryne amazonica]|uniref:phosphoinositide 3-kinase adapter protein 1 n=1 Tax=Thalassophryne amazonica TaxID=390379 RepID=UPI0014717ABD|nr:phosphoinositide 3-kinase adapter protein 1 [Thalassophryne amazonica]
MEETASSETDGSVYELIILHTSEAQEWATYLRQMLKASQMFRKRSILLYAVGPEDQLHGYNFENFQSSKCIVLILTSAFLDILGDPKMQGALQSLLHPPHRVVALLCGVSEDDVVTDGFEDWPSWRKLYTEDEPSLYVSIILESMNDSRRHADECEETAAPTVETVPEETKDTVMSPENPVRTENSTSKKTGLATPVSCLTVQPDRVLCGEHKKLFIILTHKVDDQSVPEVEFSCENGTPNRVPGTVENEYTICVTAPDMPAGVALLTLHTHQLCVSLKPVTYYTHMEEVSHHLTNAVDPINFICQAFNITTNSRESLDNMLTESLKSRMPANGFQLIGIRQIEEDNMAAYQRNEELPTLLHFAAKYGLKKLTTILLQCPGALQAYSVMNKHGDYPNTLAEKNGFSDLRQFIDEFVETADMLKTHFEDSFKPEEGEDVYELMSAKSQDMMMKYSGCSEDIYESMLGIDPDCAEDLYEAMSAVEECQNPEELILRKFFQAKPQSDVKQDENENLKSEEEENRDQNQNDAKETEEVEDPYSLYPEDIYDTVDTNATYNSGIFNRPPAPIPRPESKPEQEKPVTYISRVFSDKGTPQSKAVEIGSPAEVSAGPVTDVAPISLYDPYAGMKTPGQRQLISLQERVKVGEITVDEAVEEFKAWKFDHQQRTNSMRYQQENLKKLRDSITRRHKEREKGGKELDYEISAPLQRNLYWGSSTPLQCALYESTPQVEAPPPPVLHNIQRGSWKTGITLSTSNVEISAPLQRNLYWGSGTPLQCALYESTPQVVAKPPPSVHNIQRGSWKTGSTSSTSSTESNRLSTHSTLSYSSGTEPDFEDQMESLPPPPRPPPRHSDAPSVMPPPRIPPRIPERVPEKMLHEHYTSCPTRALPQRPTPRATDSAPPLPRRMR